MIGDPRLFMRADMMEQSSRIVQPVLDVWTADKADVPRATIPAAMVRRRRTSCWSATEIGPGGR
jgi:glucose-6-phosphate 1-dehydrogenase